ncbi:cytochrome c-type biogenesis CcmF C-terminal domain-containing protein [Alkalilimnicola ehrlichii]|uniref:Cytochrome c-type biogenesis protein CcmF n=1 Tax=Alkalilimnicola ehrlichii TaxID=351052 RepID=A0A3E0WRX7_9GAMM|nr:cytochrome c-type biogenesis CcmF C-terminal domain-containing protein [Alkalilimnicola ehrlichii]RFA35734.1 hypothetical protein CAL65_12460 [Alkalilimnicola ehrlichii]
MLFVLFVSNPFERLLPAPVEGLALDPLPQGLGFALQTPLLLIGAVGFAVVFSFAIAALIGGDLDATWAHWSRPWTAVTWSLLTGGVALNSLWAYPVPGWEGAWFPVSVEQAFLLPWLAATALMHALAATEKRGVFRRWTVLLAVLTFAFCLLAVLLSSAGGDAYATDRMSTVFLWGLFVAVVGSALLLYFRRAPGGGWKRGLVPISRESALLLNNVVLAAGMAVLLSSLSYFVLLGVFDARPAATVMHYLKLLWAFLALAVLALAGAGPLLRWKGDDARRLVRILSIGVSVSLLGAMVSMHFVSGVSFLASLGVGVALWVMLSAGWRLWDGVRQNDRRLPALARLPRAIWGMALAHLGLAQFALAVTLASSFGSERTFSVISGDSIEVQGYVFYVDDVPSGSGEGYVESQGIVRVSRAGVFLAELNPEHRVDRGEQAIRFELVQRVGAFRKLFVRLEESPVETTWQLQIQYKPFTYLGWTGCLLMVLGGLLAASDRRYQRLARHAAAARAVVAR